MLFQRDTSYFQGQGMSRADFIAPAMRNVCGFVLKGVKAEEIKTIELRVNGLVVISLAGWFDEEQGQHVGAGVQAVEFMKLHGPLTIEGGGVPLLFGKVAGLWERLKVDGRSIHQALLVVELNTRPDQFVRVRCEWLISCDAGVVGPAGRVF